MEGSPKTLKRKYAKKAKNEIKVEMKKKKTIKNAADEEIRDSDAKVSDAKKKTENVSRIVTRKKQFEIPIKEANQVKSDGKKQAVKPQKAVGQMKSNSTSTDNQDIDKMNSGGQERAVKPMQAVDQMKSDGKKQAVKPKKEADQMKSDSTSTDDETQSDGLTSSDEVIENDKIKSGRKGHAVKPIKAIDKTKSDGKKQAQKPKKAADRMNSDYTLTGDDIQPDGSSSSGEEIGDDESDVVNSDGESVVAILSRMEGKLNSILRDRRTDKRMFSALVHMPYNLKEDITSYNTKLINSELFIKFATFLESVGGRNDGKIVCNMLHQIATPNLLSQFEWRETSPISFQSLANIVKVIHVAAEKKCSDKYDLTVCGEIIKTALRNARLCKN